MKKFILSMMFIIFLAPLVRGQAALLVLLFGDKVASEELHFSLKLGANVGNLSGIDGTETHWGPNFGLLVNIKLSDKFSLIPEFSPLSKKGAKNIPLVVTGNPNLDALLANSPKSKRTLEYIDLAVVGRYNINDRLSVGAGPYMGILTGATDVYTATAIEDDDLNYKDNIKSQLNSLDFGAIFEVTYKLSKARGGKGLAVHVRYQLGLTDIVKDNVGDAVTNSCFQLTVSFPFIKDEGKKE